MMQDYMIRIEYCIIAIVANVSFRRKIDKICQTPDTDKTPKAAKREREEIAQRILEE